MFEVIARLKVRDGELEGFKRQAAEVMREAREKDTKTLRYDWFLSADGQCEVREDYQDCNGLLDHNDHVREARGQLFHEFAYDHDMRIYGKPSPKLLAVFEAMGDHVKYTQFHLFQSLDSAVEALDEVSA